MTRPVANLSYSNTFGHVLSTVNILSDTVSRFAVTTNGTGWANTLSVAVGNAYVNGSINATQLFSDSLGTNVFQANSAATFLGAVSITGSSFSAAHGATQLTSNATHISFTAANLVSPGRFSSNATHFTLTSNTAVTGTFSSSGNSSISSNTLFVSGSTVVVNGQQTINGTLAAGNTSVGILTAESGSFSGGGVTVSGALSVSNTAAFGNTTVTRLTASGPVVVSNTAAFGNTTVTGSLTATGGATFQAGVTSTNGQFSGALSANGALVVANTASFGNTTVTGSLTSTGAISSATANTGNLTAANLTVSANAAITRLSAGNTSVTGTLAVSQPATFSSTLQTGNTTVVGSANVAGTLTSLTTFVGNTTVTGFMTVLSGATSDSVSARSNTVNTYINLINNNNVTHRVGLESNTLVFGTAANTALKLHPIAVAETFDYGGSPESNTVVSRLNGRSLVVGDLIVTGTVRATSLTSNTGDLANLFIRNDIDNAASGIVTFNAGVVQRGPMKFDTTADAVPTASIRWQSAANTNSFEISSTANNSALGALRLIGNGSNVATFTAALATFPAVSAATFTGTLNGNANTATFANTATSATTANSAAQLTTARNINLSGAVTGAASFNGTANASISTSFNSVVPVAFGGTSFSSYSAGDILYADSTSSLTRLNINNSNNVLLTDAGVNQPQWGKLPLATHVSGTLPTANLPVAADGVSSNTSIVRSDDSRLGNSRTPTAHVLDSASHTISGKTAGQIVLATSANTFAFTTVSGDATVNGTGTLTISNNAVTSGKIANGSIVVGKIANDAILTDAIANSAVTLSKLNGIANARILGRFEMDMSSGHPKELTAEQARGLIGVAMHADYTYSMFNADHSFGFTPDIAAGAEGQQNPLTIVTTTAGSSNRSIDTPFMDYGSRIEFLNVSAGNITINNQAGSFGFPLWVYMDSTDGSLYTSIVVGPRRRVLLISLGTAAPAPGGVTGTVETGFRIVYVEGNGVTFTDPYIDPTP